MFEYDPKLKEKANYRLFFREKARLVQVVPFDNTVLEEWCALLYRQKFLKDYILRPSIDETGAGALQVIHSS